MNLSKDQVKKILQDAPPEADKRVILRKLVERGNILEGYNDNKPQFAEEGVIPESPMETVKNVGTAVGQGIQEGAGYLAEKAGQYGGSTVGKLAAAALTVPAVSGQAIEAASQAIPSTPGQVVATAATGPIMEATGAAISGTANAIAPQLSGKVAQAIKTAANMNIPLTPAEMLQSKPLAAVETLLEKLPFSSGMLQKFRQARAESLIEAKNAIAEKMGAKVAPEVLGAQAQEQLGEVSDKALARRVEQLTSARDNIVSKFGPSQETEAVGQKAQELLAQRSQLARAKSDRLYAEARDAIPKAQDQVADNSLRQMASDILKRYENTPTAISGQARSMLESISNGPKVGAYTFEQLDGLRSTLGSLIAKEDSAVAFGHAGIKGQGSIEGGIYKQLRGAVTDDMQAFTEHLGGDVKTKFDIARAFHRDDYKGIYGQRIDAVRAITRKNPEDVYKSIIQNGDVTEIRAVKKAIGEEGFFRFQQRFVQDVLGNVGEDVPKSEEVIKRLNRYGAETLKEILPQQIIKDIKSFADTGNTPQFIQSGIEKSLSKILTKDPAKAFNYILSAEPLEAQRLKNYLGPKIVAPLKRHVVENILGEHGQEIATSNAIRRSLANIGDDALKVWFDPRELQAIKDVGTVSQLMPRMQDLAGNSSGSAGSLISYKAMGGAGIGGTAGALYVLNSPDFKTAQQRGKQVVAGSAAATLLGAPALTRLYLSDYGRKLLTTGLKMPAGDPRARIIGAAIASFLARPRSNDNERK